MAENTPRTTAKKTTKAPTKKTTTRKAAAKQAPARKTPARKTSAEKTPARKTSAEKTSARSTASPTDDTTRGGNGNADGGSGSGSGPSSDSRRRTPTGARAALLAAQQLVELTGKTFEGIVGISKTEDGWTAQVEILEMRRIPDTTDVLAVYEVSVDRDGDLVGYRRTDRYTRGSAGEDRR